MLVFDHIGLVVPDLDTGADQIGRTLPVTGWTARFDDAGLGVSVQFARDAGGVVFELIAPLGDRSPVAAIVKKREGILNQLAYRVADLAAAAQAMRAARAVPLGRPAPAIAFGGAQVQFFMSQMNVVIELIEAPAFAHDFRA